MFEDIAFSHAFQPIIDIEQEKIISYEVLLRGKNNEPPGYIFDKIHQSQFMAFDQFSREKALTLAAKLGVSCNINLNFTPGSILFEDGSYVTKTIQKAKSLGFTPRQLTLEITESELVNDMGEFSDILNHARRENAFLAIDDFGAGYAGLNMLADVQPDLVKIDMSLLRGVDSHGPRQAIISAINNVCLDLGIDVLAEGVETEKEFYFLQKLGISIYQGYLFAKPAFEELPITYHLPTPP